MISSKLPLRHKLIVVVDSFCAATGSGRGTVSAIILKRGSILDRIASGDGDLTTRSYERAMAWLSANWPAETEWPDGISRPETQGTAVVVGGGDLSHDGENGAALVSRPVPSSAGPAREAAR